MYGKLQDAERTARWHNIYMIATLVFLATTILFASLFGGYYSAWDHERSSSPACMKRMGGLSFVEGYDQEAHDFQIDEDGRIHYDHASVHIESKSCDADYKAAFPPISKTNGGRRLSTPTEDTAVTQGTPKASKTAGSTSTVCSKAQKKMCSTNNDPISKTKRCSGIGTLQTNPAYGQCYTMRGKKTSLDPGKSGSDKCFDVCEISQCVAAFPKIKDEDVLKDYYTTQSTTCDSIDPNLGTGKCYYDKCTKLSIQQNFQSPIPSPEPPPPPSPPPPAGPGS